MAYDVKKAKKELYGPGRSPAAVVVPAARFAAVDGCGDPNDPKGNYQKAVGKLYSLLYTIRMSPKNGLGIDGYEPFVVAPLEGLWAQDGLGPDENIDYARKADFVWTAMIRLPEFIDDEGFQAAVSAAQQKKGTDLSDVRLLDYDEGLCVQCMHVGPYDDEPQTMEKMWTFMQSEGLVPDRTRRHHEIYLSDPRRTAPERLRTVLRTPVVRSAAY